MTRGAWIVGAVAALFLGGCLALVAGCGPSTPTAAQQAQVWTFSAELADCVAGSTSRADYEACRARVTAKYNVDGSAP